MNDIQIFENPEFGNVRTLEGANGEVLFCGTDIAKAIVEFEKQGSFNALWQDGCNKSFCKLYNLMVGELGSDWRLAV